MSSSALSYNILLPLMFLFIHLLAFPAVYEQLNYLIKHRVIVPSENVFKKDMLLIILFFLLLSFGASLLFDVITYQPTDELTAKTYYEDPLQTDIKNKPLTRQYKAFFNKIFVYNDTMYTTTDTKDYLNAYETYDDMTNHMVKYNRIQNVDNLEIVNLILAFEIEEEEFITTERGKTQNGNTSYFHTLPILTTNKHAFNMPKGEAVYQLEHLPTTQEFCLFYDNTYYSFYDYTEDIVNELGITEDTFFTKDDANIFTFYQSNMPNAYQAYFMGKKTNIYLKVLYTIIGFLCLFFSSKNLSKLLKKIHNKPTDIKLSSNDHYYNILKHSFLALLLFSISALYVMIDERNYTNDSLTIYSENSNNDNSTYKSVSYKDINGSVKGINDNRNFREHFYKQMIYHNDNIYVENPDMFFYLFSVQKVELEEFLTAENFDKNETYHFKNKHSINGIEMTEVSGDKILVFEKSIIPTEQLFINVGDPIQLDLQPPSYSLTPNNNTNPPEIVTLFPHTLPVLEKEGQAFNMSTNNHLYTTNFDVNRDNYFFVLFNNNLYEMTNDLLGKFQKIANNKDCYFTAKLTTEVTRTGTTIDIRPLTIEDPSYLYEYYNGDDYPLKFKHIAYFVWGSFIVITILLIKECKRRKITLKIIYDNLLEKLPKN